MEQITQQDFQALWETEFFNPCDSKQELKAWISTFLKIDLPDQIIDEHSTSTPMDFVWEIYNTARLGLSVTHVGAASRASMKTLSVSILEFLLILHFRKKIVHLAAVLDQSIACIDYLNQFLALPIMAQYVGSNTNRKKTFKNLPVNQYKSKRDAVLKVLVANTEGANSSRANVLCYDEVDLIDKKVLSESAMVADPDEDGNPPIFIYISSRKTGVGPVQEKIDLSADPINKIRLHKWSLVDFLKVCKPDVYKPDKPAIRYIHPDTLEIKDTEDLVKLAHGQQEMFNPVSCWEGCLTCQAFVICQGRAPLQKQDVRVLREIGFVATVVRETADSDKIKAQLLNLKPESAGQVFNKFSRETHYRSIEDCYKFAFNEEYDANLDGVLTKRRFVSMLSEHGWYVQCGVDFGWQALSVAVLVAHHKGMDKTIIVHVDFAQGYANQDWLLFIKENIYDVYGFDLLCPDCADMSAPKIASKLGMPTRNKKPPKIDKGISWLRSQLWSPSKQKSSLMVLADTNTTAIAKMFEEYQYKKTPTGFLFTQYEDDTVNSDLCFEPNTWVITKRGFVAIETVQSSSDLVLTKEGTWRKVIATMNRPFTGQIWKVRVFGKPTINCTSNHPFWATLDPYNEPCSYMTASRLSLNLRKGAVYTTFSTSPFIDKPVVYDLASYVDENYEVDDYQIYFKNQKNSIGRFLVVDEALAFVAGCAVAAGGVRTDHYCFFHESPENLDVLFVTLHNYFEQLHIETVLNNSQYERGSLCAPKGSFRQRLEVRDTIFKKLFESITIYRNDNRFPEFYDDMDRKSLLAMMAGFTLVNAQLFKNCRFALDNITTASQVYYILVKLGYAPIWMFRPGHASHYVFLTPAQRTKLLEEFFQIPWIKECWAGKTIGTDTIGDFDDNAQVNINGQLFSKVTSISSEYYQGDVYNLTVDESHSYTAGLCAVSNCDALRYGVDTFIAGNAYTIQAGQGPVPQYYKGIEIVTGERPTLPMLNQAFVNEEIKVHYASEYGLDIEDPKTELAKINSVEQSEKNVSSHKGFTFSF